MWLQLRYVTEIIRKQTRYVSLLLLLLLLLTVQVRNPCPTCLTPMDRGLLWLHPHNGDQARDLYYD